MKRAKSDTEISKRETKETKIEINRETKETQTEIKGETIAEPTEIQRLFQLYKVTDEAVNIELSVQSIDTLPFTFWRKGTLTIAIKENFSSSYDILMTIPLRSSTCNVKKSWTFRKDREVVNLDLRLKYRDNKGQVHHAIKQVIIDEGQTPVTFDKITEPHTDQDCQVHKWSFVLFDFDGSTKQVRSNQLSTVPKRNSTVYLVTENKLFLVEVLEVAETKKELDIFKKKWKKTLRAELIDDARVEWGTGYLEKFPLVPPWACVLMDNIGYTFIVESENLSPNARKNATVEYWIGNNTYEVEVLELAETEEQLVIFEKEWQTSDRAKDIIRLRSSRSSEDNFLKRFPMEKYQVSKSDEPQLEYGQSKKIEFNITLTKKYPEVTYTKSPGLCEEESTFVKQRRNKIYDSLKQLDIDMEKKKVPNIAIIGSGGGMRAVIGMGAALDQLKKENILDCSMYVAGLSGSAWYLLTLYAHGEKLEPADVNRHIQTKVKIKFSIYFWMAMKVLMFYIKSKAYYHGDYFTFTNLFGEMIGDLLLDKNSSKKWSDVAKKLDEGCNPLPLVSALHVQNEKTMKHYNEWMEFSPYQVLYPRLGAGIEMNRFGDKFYRGFCTHQYKEQPIHFLQGICGSAYAIVRDYRPQGNEWYIRGIVNDKNDIKDSETWSIFNRFDSSFVAKVPHFLQGVSKFESLLEESDEFNAIWKEVEGEEDITELKKGNIPVYPTGVWHMRWWRLKDTIWRLVKGLSRIALTCFTVNFGYRDISRVTGEVHANRMMLVDAGIAFNSPYPSVLHPSRSVDIVLSFDFSDRGEDAALPFEELKKAEEWARGRGVPFPELYPKLNKMEEQWRNGVQKEVYIFSSPGSPTIVHFVMINKSFRLENDSISENFDEFLENEDISMEVLLDAMMKGAVLREGEKAYISKLSTKDEQKNVLLEKIMKQRNPALKQLTLLLETAGIEEHFQQIIRYVPIWAILHIMVKGSVISADEKKNIEEDGSEVSQEGALLDLMKKRRDPALKQLLEIFPKRFDIDSMKERKGPALQQLLETSPKSALVENFDKILKKIGMQEIIGDLKRVGALLLEDEFEIYREPWFDPRKHILLEIFEKKNVKQLLKTVETQQCKHKALHLVASTEFKNKDTFAKNFDEILETIGMQKIVCDLKRGGVILAEDESELNWLQGRGRRKEALLEVLEKKKQPALKQLVQTLQQQQCEYEALQLLASPDFENKDSVTDIFDNILEHVKLKDVLCHFERFSVISGYEKCRIETCSTHDDQKHALLKIITKRRDAALKHLMQILDTDIFKKVFKDILENFGMRKTVFSLMMDLVKSEDEKRRIEQVPIQHLQNRELLDIIAGQKEKALEHLLKTLPRNSISNILDEMFENGNIEQMLANLDRGTLMDLNDINNINECETYEEQKNAILKIIMKLRNPKELVEKLEDKGGAPNNFDILPEYGTMRFSYSEEEFYKFNSLVRHNVKNNMSEIIKCIKQKVIGNSID